MGTFLQLTGAVVALGNKTFIDKSESRVWWYDQNIVLSSSAS